MEETLRDMRRPQETWQIDLIEILEKILNELKEQNRILVGGQLSGR